MIYYIRSLKFAKKGFSRDSDIFEVFQGNNIIIIIIIFVRNVYRRILRKLSRIGEDFEMNAINARIYVEATSYLRLAAYTMLIEFITCRLENIIIN